MKVIKNKILFLICLIILVIVVIAEVFIEKRDYIIISIKYIFTFSLLILIATLILLIFEYKKMIIAKLITENKIFDIEVVKIHKGTPKTIVYTVSCFEILLDSKIIKYNIDRIELLNIKISRNIISFIYGKDAKFTKLKILHGIKDEKRIKEIVNRFKYELGINPIIRDF